MKRKYSLLIKAVLLGGIILVSGCGTTVGTNSPRAESGNTVQVEYTGKLKDGSVFDSSIGKEPLEFTLGSGQVIPGFDKAVTGMRVGDTKTVTIPVDEAYGPRKDSLIQTVSRDQFAGDAVLTKGQKLQVMSSDGNIMVVTVTGITDTSVTLDANHPLAGKDLIFELKLVAIK